MATDRTVTVKSSGGDYTSLSASLAAEAADLVSLDRRLIIECYDFEDTAQVNWPSGFTCDTTRYIWIKAVDDHGGKYSTGSYRLAVEVGADGQGAIQIEQSADVIHLYLDGIQIVNTGPTTLAGSALYVWATASGSLVDVDRLIAIDNQDNHDSFNHGLRLRDSDTMYYIRNSLIVRSSNAIKQDFYKGQHRIFIDNCTIDNCGYGYAYTGLSLDSNTIVRNSRFTNLASGTLDQGIGQPFSTECDFNLTDNDLPAAWGVNCISSSDSPTIDYVDSTNSNYLLRDYHINSTSDSGYGAGTDLSSAESRSFTTDIDGDTRSRWDIGADEYTVGVITVIPTAISASATTQGPLDVVLGSLTLTTIPNAVVVGTIDPSVIIQDTPVEPGPVITGLAKIIFY